MGGEGDERLTVEVVLLEEGEHHLWVGAPPDRTADEDGRVLLNVLYGSVEGWQFIFLLFLLAKSHSGV